MVIAYRSQQSTVASLPPPLPTLENVSSTNRRMTLVLPHLALPTTSSLHVTVGMRPGCGASSAASDAASFELFCSRHAGPRQLLLSRDLKL